MKKKLLFICLTLALLFTAACSSKQTEPEVTPTPTATPTPSPSPTPVPENLAETNLKAITNLTKAKLNDLSNQHLDISNGFGCDFNMTLSFGEEYAELMGLSGLGSFGFQGSMDMYDALGLNGSVTLNDVSLLDMALYSDYKNFYCNLPKYSAQYFALDPEMLTEDSMTGEELQDYATLLQNQMTDKEALALFALAAGDFAACFEPEPGIETDVTVGTGKYTITADRHTIRAGAQKLSPVVTDFMEVLKNYPSLATSFEDLEPENITDLVLYYYAGDNNSFAWELYPVEEDASSVVFIYTPDGFCLYEDFRDGTTETVFYSDTQSGTSGKITFPAELALDSDVINYSLEDDGLQADGTLGEYNFTLTYRSSAETISTAISITNEEFSIYGDASGNKNQMAMTMGLSEGGMEALLLHADMKYREYQAVAAPGEVTDIDTWAETMNYNLLLSDVFLILSEHPELAEMVEAFSAGKEEEEAYDTIVDFSGMTGYAVDANGYVDFTPTTEDIIAMGIPSTGVDHVPASEEQLSALGNVISHTYADCEYESYDYYNVSGNIYDDSVSSTYLCQELYYAPACPENCILITYEAFTGDLVGFCLDDIFPETALKNMNALLYAWGIDYTVLAEDLENGILVDDFVIYGYQEDGYYEILCIASPEY